MYLIIFILMVLLPKGFQTNKHNSEKVNVIKIWTNQGSPWGIRGNRPFPWFFCCFLNCCTGSNALGSPISLDSARPSSITQKRGREWPRFIPSSPAESPANSKGTPGAEASRKWYCGPRLQSLTTKQVPQTLHPTFPTHKERGCTRTSRSFAKWKPTIA